MNTEIEQLKVNKTINYIDNKLKKFIGKNSAINKNLNINFLTLVLRSYTIDYLRTSTFFDKTINLNIEFLNQYINLNLMEKIKNFASAEALIFSINNLNKLSQEINKDNQNNYYEIDNILLQIEIVTNKELLSVDSNLNNLQTKVDYYLDALPEVIKAQN